MLINVTLKGNWKEQKLKLKAKFPHLTDEDLKYEEGKKEAMLENIQSILGKSKTDLYNIIENL